MEVEITTGFSLGVVVDIDLGTPIHEASMIILVAGMRFVTLPLPIPYPKLRYKVWGTYFQQWSSPNTGNSCFK